MTEIKSPPRHNFALRFLERFIAVPRRFTAAFVLILPLFAWMALGLYSGNFYGDDEPYWCGEIPGPGDPNPFPLTLLIYCSSLFKTLGLFLAVQIALALTFALLQERGAEVSARRRAAIRSASFFLCALLCLATFRKTVFDLEPFFMLIAAAVLIFALAAVPLAADGIAEGKKALPAFLGRTLLAAIAAALATAAAIFAYSSARESLSYNSLRFYVQLYVQPLAGAFILGVFFPWLFMAGIPDAPHQTAPLQESPHE